MMLTEEDIRKIVREELRKMLAVRDEEQRKVTLLLLKDQGV